MSHTCKTVTINKITDRVLVRQQVREAARSLSFGLLEQAKISLAVYNVISKIDMGISCEGEVIVNHVHDHTREGMQVICTTRNCRDNHLSAASFNDRTWLVDELNVEKLEPSGLRVTIVMWAV